MSYLFIDSTYDLTIGVLDDGLSWLSFETLSGQKVSTVIQARAHEFLKQHKIEPGNLKGIFTINGPGFYTGLRLSEGFADVLKFFGVPAFSFYSYEIPNWCGKESGTWFTKAYRGEYFLYKWQGDQGEQQLLSSKEIPEALAKLDKIFIHSQSSLDKLSTDLIQNSATTLDLLKNYPKEIFSKVLELGLKRDAFYFRAPEDEFKVNP